MPKQQHPRYCLILANAVILTLAAVLQEDNAQRDWANVEI